jgi:hypothetical protein
MKTPLVMEILARPISSDECCFEQADSCVLCVCFLRRSMTVRRNEGGPAVARGGGSKAAAATAAI